MLHAHFQRNSSVNYPLAPRDPQFIKDRVDLWMRENDRHAARAVLGTGQAPKDAIVMQSNDYLDIARDKRIAMAKADALLATGHGESISSVFTHDRQDARRHFEHRIAAMVQADDAVLVMSGYNANTGIIQAFAGPETPVYIDLMAHASLWEGILCARARARPFRHNDANDLARKIQRYGPGLVVIDTLYSTNGNVCPLHDIVEAAETGNCALIVDETHSFGCHGPNGAGMVVEAGLAHRVHLRTFGLSKAMAARGGIVAGSMRNIEHFRYEARPMIFSTSVLEYEISGFNMALDIISTEPWRQAQLHRNHAYLKAGMINLGYDVHESDSQILSLVTGTLEDTQLVREYLDKSGVFGSVFAPPATPKNMSLIRFTLNSRLTTAQLDHVLNVFALLPKDMDISGIPCRAAYPT